MTETFERPTCTVRDGKFVVPCDHLSKLIEGYAAFSKAKGVRVWQYYSRSQAGMTRSFVGIKCKEWPDGFLFSFCPCCGADISAPFAESDDDAKAA